MGRHAGHGRGAFNEEHVSTYYPFILPTYDTMTPPTTIQDVLISAPQKGWSGPACCALVMLSERARAVALDDKSQPANNSFCCNLRQWIGVMDEYDAGRCKYYTTLPTDALVRGKNRSHVYCPRQPFRTWA